MIFKQETIKSWFTGVGSSINNEVVQPFQNANSIISKYNLAIQHNSLTQQGWQRLLTQSDDSLKAYLTSIKGTTASMSGYNVSLQDNLVGFTKITKAMQQYNVLGATNQKEQQAFATAVGVTNTKLGSYLTGLNGAKASLSGYGLSLIASTAKTIGLTVATTALNATLTTGISLIVSGLISSFVSWIHKSEEITEKAQEAADKINSINDSLKSNTETVENAKKRYAELTQEVENLGKITQSQGTLSNEEYEEFLDLSNQLAGIFPSLTKNYDVNGNAILDLSGDVNTIVGSLDSLIQKEKELANQKIMEEFPDVFKGWNQDLSDAEQKVKSAKTEFHKINQAYSSLEKGQSIQMGFNVNGSNINTDGKITTIGQYEGWLKNLGLTYEETVVSGGIVVTAIGDIDTAFTSKLEKAREDLQYAQQQLEGQTSSINQYLNTWLQGEFSYIQIEDSGLQTAIQDMLFNFDWDNISEDKRGDWNYVSEYLRRNILFEINKVQDNPVISKAISEVFTNAELTPDEKANYLQQIKDFFGENSTVVISLKPQIEETETLQKQYDKAIEDTKKKFDSYDPTAFFKEHSINTQEKIDAWQKIAQGVRDAAEAEKEYLSQGYIETPISFSSVLTTSQESLDKFQSSVQSAKDAYTTLLSGNYSSSELLNSIQTITQAVSDMGGSLNWEFINSQTNSLELLGDAIQHISQKYAESVLSGAGIDINSEFGQMLANIIQQAYETEAEFADMNAQLDNLQSSYQTLTGILESFNDTGYISLDNLQSLLTADENLITMLEVENGQLVLNQAAYEDLVAVQLLEFKAKLNEAAAAEIEMLAKQKAEQATNQNANASENAVAKLDAETAAFNRNTTAAISNAVAKAEESGVSEDEIQGIFDKYDEIWNSAMNNYSGDFDGFMGGTKSAGSAGKSAGYTYVSQFEKELDKLKTSRDQGKITEKQYLDYLRKLYQHFFRDKKKYAEEYAKYENEYLQGMKSLYESALSGITSLLDKQIDSYEDSKSAAVDSLEAERDARIEVLEAQKEQYEEQIKLIDKQIKDKESLIDNINDEIDAIRDANEERQRQLTLQEKQIALERMLNQRTILQYSDDKGMHYVQDTDGIRSAKQELDDAQTEIEIADKEKQIKLIEKEIDLLEERKDSINEQIDLIDTQIDQINAQYDKMIADTEKYWDNLISGMENYKSRWQELAEIEEQTKLISTLDQLGISANDILNMSETTFSKFKDEYIGILADIYSENDSMLSSLADSTGRSIGEMGSYLESTQGYINNLSGISESLNPVSEAINNVDDSMNALASSASAVNEETSGITSNMGELDGYAEGVSANLSDISTTLTAFPDAEKFNAIAEAFRNLAEALKYVSQVLGAEGSEGQGGIASQFSNLKNAIDQVAAAISGGQSNASGDDKNGSSKSIGHKGGGNSLTKALSSLSEAVGSVIGEPDAEGDGTVIGGFGSLKTAVNEVSSAIGSGDSENEEKSDTGDEENEGNLTTSITGLGTTTEDTLGKPGGEGVIGRFEQFKNVLDEASQHVQSIPRGLEDINGKTVECTIKVNIETSGSLPSALGVGMGLASAVYNAKYEGSANATGTALVTGNWAVQSAEKHTLMGELGRELIVRRGRFFTVGNYGAEFVDIQKGDIVFNHRQTEQLLKNGHISGRGKAYADGTVGNPLASGKYTPIGQDSHTWELLKAFDPLVQKLLNGEEQLINNAFSNEQAQMDKLMKDMATTNIVSKNLQPDIHVNDINITCPGITSREVARQVGVELNHMFNGLHNYADQQSMIR